MVQKKENCINWKRNKARTLKENTVRQWQYRYHSGCSVTVSHCTLHNKSNCFTGTWNSNVSTWALSRFIVLSRQSTLASAGFHCAGCEVQQRRSDLMKGLVTPSNVRMNQEGWTMMNIFRFFFSLFQEKGEKVGSFFFCYSATCWTPVKPPLHQHPTQMRLFAKQFRLLSFIRPESLILKFQASMLVLKKGTHGSHVPCLYDLPTDH